MSPLYPFFWKLILNNSPSRDLNYILQVVVSISRAVRLSSSLTVPSFPSLCLLCMHVHSYSHHTTHHIHFHFSSPQFSTSRFLFFFGNLTLPYLTLPSQSLRCHNLARTLYFETCHTLHPLCLIAIMIINIAHQISCVSVIVYVHKLKFSPALRRFICGLNDIRLILAFQPEVL